MIDDDQSVHVELEVQLEMAAQRLDQISRVWRARHMSYLHSSLQASAADRVHESYSGVRQSTPLKASTNGPASSSSILFLVFSYILPTAFEGLARAPSAKLNAKQSPSHDVPRESFQPLSYFPGAARRAV